MRYQLTHKAGKHWAVYDEQDNELAKFQGTRPEAQKQFDAWLEEQGLAEPKRVSSEKVDVEEARKTFSGAALTAKLNEGVDRTFVPSEWSPRAGVFNEGNQVRNVPAGFRVVWATPLRVWGGHYQELIRMGCRPVYREELASDPEDSSAMYVSFLDESEPMYVEQNGSRLVIGPASRLDTIRKLQYDRSMQDMQRKADEKMQAIASSVGSGPVRVNSESAAYDPMGRS